MDWRRLKYLSANKECTGLTRLLVEHFAYRSSLKPAHHKDATLRWTVAMNTSFCEDSAKRTQGAAFAAVKAKEKERDSKDKGKEAKEADEENHPEMGFRYHHSEHGLEIFRTRNQNEAVRANFCFFNDQSDIAAQQIKSHPASKSHLYAPEASSCSMLLATPA